MNTFLKQPLTEVTDGTISFHLGQFHCLTNFRRSVYHDAVLRETWSDDAKRIWKAKTKRSKWLQVVWFMLQGLCFYTIMVQICLHMTGSVIYNKINVFHLNKAEDTYKGYNWHQQLYHFPSDATISSAHCAVALVHLVMSHHDGIQHYVVVITYRSRYLLGAGHVSVNHYSSTTNISKCMSADSGYFCQNIKQLHSWM
jgi:hypothetical protein